MRLLPIATLLLLSFASTPVYAAAQAIEGAEAEKLYAADKGKAQVLVQKDKIFILRAADGTEILKPETITVKAGERFYVVNEEHSFVHNIYDVTDSSWVLKKQQPGGVAAIIFDTPKKHSLRCAIHPTMKINVDVK